MRRGLLLVLGTLLFYGCTHKVDIAPITIEPIHVTMDIRIRVDQQLAEFFDFEDEIENESGK